MSLDKLVDVALVVMCAAVTVAALSFVASSVANVIAVRQGTKRFMRGMDELERQHDELERASRLDDDDERAR